MISFSTSEQRLWAIIVEGGERAEACEWIVVRPPSSLTRHPEGSSRAFRRLSKLVLHDLHRKPVASTSLCNDRPFNNYYILISCIYVSSDAPELLALDLDCVCRRCSLAFSLLGDAFGLDHRRCRRRDLLAVLLL